MHDFDDINTVREHLKGASKSSLFHVVWTSFGIGFEHGMNPSLASTLSFLTHNVIFTKGKLYFEVYQTDAREDLQLLSLLKDHGTKELYVSTFSTTGDEHAIRSKFTTTALEDYNIGYSWHTPDTIGSTSFTLTGLMDVIKK